ncbi:MAG: ribokinase, partial [Chloroflexi bacterium]|nr:ribokinase [Chloroflexota bacterium]
TRYLVVGHVCLDHTPFGPKWGGTAMFGAITALRLNAQVHVLTSMPAESVREALPDGVIVQNAETDTPLIFRHEYTDGRRELYVTHVAPTLHLEHLPEAWRNPDIVHFGPVAQEVGHDLLAAFDQSLRGASVQGWLRNWDGDGHVRPLPVAQLLEWAPPVQFSFLSEEDIGGNRAIIDFYRLHHEIVVLTDGSHGATVFEGEQATWIPAVPVREVDANGAGDVFATAFLIRYHETGSAVTAAQFAAAVASFHVEQVGIAGIPTRAQAEARWREYYGA